MVIEIDVPVEVIAIEFSVEFDYANNYVVSFQQVLKLLKTTDETKIYVLDLATKTMLLFFKMYIEGVLNGAYILPSENVTAEAVAVINEELIIIDEILNAQLNTKISLLNDVKTKFGV